MDVKLNPAASELATANAIFAGRTRRHYVPPLAGTHSIKSVLEGRATWNVEGRARVVTPDRCLAVNQGETYSLSIESATPVQTCCAFFAPGYLESLKAESLLEPTGQRQSVELSSRYENTDIRPRMIRVWRSLQAEDLLAAEAAMLDLGVATLALAGSQQNQLSQIAAARPATREELFRRLNLARDFIYDNLDHPLTVEKIADIACLAPYHFHRLFHSSYGVPVSRFVRDLRMQNAARILKTTDRPVEEIALDCGYESPTAFTRAFHRRFGLSPRAYRVELRKNGEI